MPVTVASDKTVVLSPHQQEVFLDRYALKGPNGELLETRIEETWRRVARAVARAEPAESQGYWEQRFYSLFEGFKFLPGGRILAGAGSGHLVTHFNCFACPLPEDSRKGIIETLEQMTELMARGGGVGINISSIRPRGSYISSVNGTASGPVSWAELYSTTTGRIISQGGSRRGALMLLLDIRHPDVEEFIAAKDTPGHLEYANLSLAISDDFMQAVAAGREWHLTWPLTPPGQAVRPETIQKTLPARELWRKVAEHAWKMGDPGVVFLERCNKLNNLGYATQLVTTNPCWSGDTKVWTIYGPRTFAELAEHGEDVPVLSQDDAGKLCYKLMRRPRLTRSKASVVKITLDDGTELRCTPDHHLYRRDGTQVEARELQPGDRLASVYRSRANSKGFVRLSNGGADVVLEHHLVGEWKYGRRPNYPTEHCHHVDQDRANNHPDNLEYKLAHSHVREHKLGANNPNFGVWDERNPLFGRSVAGADNPRYRHELDDTQLRAMRSQGLSNAAIAKQVGCSKYTVAKRLGYQRPVAPVNHRVVAVEWLDEPVDVYNGTVDDTHRFFVVCEQGGILSRNCGEQPLDAFGCCNLGALNVSAFVKSRLWGELERGLWREHGRFDWAGLQAAVETAVRFLDDVIDIDPGVESLPEIRQNVLRFRRVGLGTMGLADALIKLGLRYGSPESLEFIDYLYNFIKVVAYQASVRLADEKGPFPAFDADRFVDGAFVQTLPNELQADIAELGIRNGTLLSQAPTGTISLLAGCSSGIEPVFLFELERKDRTGTHVMRHPLYQEWAAAHPDQVAAGSHPSFLVTALELTPEEHVRVQAAVQQHTDASVSKTVNLPNSATVEDVLRTYELAYELGCKGTTVFRDGSREGVLRSLDKPASEPPIAQAGQRPLGPLEGRTCKLKYPHDGESATLFVTVNGEDGRPTEVFLNGKGDQEELATVGWAVSKLLQQGYPVDDLVENLWEFRGIGGVFVPGAKRPISCIANAVAWAIEDYLSASQRPVQPEAKPNEPDPGHYAECPRCRARAYVKQEGCPHCLACGYSKCG